jgi:formyl-CoA transferase
MVAMMDFQAARTLVEGEVPGQAGNDHPTTMPQSVYPTADGFVNIAAAGKAIYARMCEALHAPELLARPEFETSALRSQNRVALNQAIGERTRNYSSAALIQLLNDAGVPCGPIYKMDQVFTDAQVQHLGMAVKLAKPEGGDVQLVGPAMKLSRTPARMQRTLGAAGEHNDEVLRAVGYSAEEIAALREGKVI